MLAHDLGVDQAVAHRLALVLVDEPADLMAGLADGKLSKAMTLLLAKRGMPIEGDAISNGVIVVDGKSLS